MMEAAMDELTASALLTNKIGLHARPSVKLTQLAKKYNAAITVAITPNGPWFDAKSPVKMMRLKAPQGETLYFYASGADAGAALEELLALVARKFDEE
jgi:phosphocarrier protein HPr